MHKMKSSAELLDEKGPFSEFIPHFKSRPSQHKMAGLIEAAIIENEKIVIEAPSGSGKTLAYLVPILNGQQKAIITTANHYLQKQLIYRDIPLVQKVLRSSKTIAALMGRANYLCPYYLEKNSHLDSGLNATLRSELSALLQLFRIQGNSSYLSAAMRPLRTYITSTTEECLGKDCSYYNLCPYFKARKKAEAADIIIVNHSLLFSNQLMHRQKISVLLPNVDVVIVDEAHRLADFSQSLIGDNLTSWQLTRFCKDVLAAATVLASDQKPAIVFVQQLLNGIKTLRSSASSLRYSPRHKTLPILEQLQSGLLSLANWLGKVVDRDQVFKLLAVRVQLIQNKLQIISSEDELYWIDGDGKGFVIRSVPRNLAERIRELMAATTSNWIFTSATLMVEGKADKFLSSIGLKNVACHQLASDFDYLNNAGLYLPDIPVNPDHEKYSEYLVSNVLSLLQITTGRVLFLFTSHSSLKKTEILLEKVKKDMQKHDDFRDFSLIVQGSMDNFRLIEQFRNSDNGLLLGTGSFWEGLDLSTVPIRCVIVDKLPFSSPDDPLIKKRIEDLDVYGVDSFNQYLLPDAVIKLRQACGRLLRKSSDKGVIVLADPRLHKMDYGHVFLNSLPSMKQSKSLEPLRELLEN